MNERLTASKAFCPDVSAVCSGAVSVNEADVLPVEGTIWPTSVRLMRILGHGRAAEARLVMVTDEAGRELVCVEKVFHPGFLTRSIYRAAYQASFPYQHNANAIQACFYRRRVAAAIVEAMLPEAAVARPLYVRWDKDSQAYVLASEFVRGRGIMPQDVDRRMVRRWLARRTGRTQTAGEQSSAPEEIEELLSLMTRLESMLIECGLTGSGWQVCKRAMVSTANLLKTETGYVVVDLESGIPSVLVPVYVWQGIRLRSLPLFDDLDPDRLMRWLAANSAHLQAVLGDSRLQQLRNDASSLIRHTSDWKLSEPAPGRRPTRLLTSDFRRRFRTQTLARWRRCDLIDVDSAEKLSRTSLFFLTPPFLLGLIPGRTGQFTLRCWANSEYRSLVRLWLCDIEHRRHCLSDYVQSKAAEWRMSGRISERRCFTGFDVRFAVNLLLSGTIPKALHLWLDDRERRKDQFQRVLLFLGSAYFQSEYGRLRIRSRIGYWQRSGRLTDDAAAALRRQLDSPAVDEYVRGFGLHVGLKLLLPLVMPLKVGGAAASLASGNPFYFLFMLMLVPILRTSLTLWRMLVSRRSASGFRQALLVGVLPVVGSLAFPVQMSACFSELSMFLLRDFASRLGCLLPIYGGKDSRTELLAIKSVNVFAECLDIWLSLTDGRRELSKRNSEEAPAAPGGETRRTIGRWELLAAEQIRKLRHEFDASEAGANNPANSTAATSRRAA